MIPRMMVIMLMMFMAAKCFSAYNELDSCREGLEHPYTEFSAAVLLVAITVLSVVPHIMLTWLPVTVFAVHILHSMQRQRHTGENLQHPGHDIESKVKPPSPPLPPSCLKVSHGTLGRQRLQLTFQVPKLSGAADWCVCVCICSSS